MIFAHTWEKVLSGKKSQTRRLRLPDYNTPYRVGKTYAVQPGRGQKAVGRIEIVSIRQEDVRHISQEDVIAEGYDRLGFFLTWTKMHDVPANRELRRFDSPPLRLLDSRPPERYQAWVLTFKVVS